MLKKSLDVKYYKGNKHVLKYLKNETETCSDDVGYVKRYLLPILNENNINNSILNVQCDFGILIIGNNDFCLPVTFSEPLGFKHFKNIIFPFFNNNNKKNKNKNGDKNNILRNRQQNACYVSSPLMQYAGYAANDLYKLKLSFIPFIIARFILSCLIVFFCITSLDQVLYVNNFLLSTNLYPDFKKSYDTKELEIIFSKIFHLLSLSHPSRIILFRSIDDFGTSKILKNILTKKPYHMNFVLSRKIHYQQVASSKLWKKSKYSCISRFFELIRYTNNNNSIYYLFL